MRSKSGIFLPFFLFLIVFWAFSSRAESAPRKKIISYHEVTFDIPFEGGGMMNYARMWAFSRYVHAGFYASGGVIERRIDVSHPLYPDLTMRTKALVLPLFGPRVTLLYHFIGLSIGVGAFYAKTDLEVEGPGITTLKGDVRGWGTGIYAPFLIADFYNEKRDMFFGFGFGGYWGTSYPDLKASSDSLTVTTDESPLNTLTFQFRWRWIEGRRERLKAHEEDF
ncbi:MAG: hypothetical protein LHV69_03835 [Elusimicrobia bacterium]|nr:hypothetical protein [Candidatus Obscuribacterium magneticum]